MFMNEFYRKADGSMQTNRNVASEINPARALVKRPAFGMVIFALAQPFLALAMRDSSLLATAHALATLAFGLWFALFSKDTRKVSYVAAYIAGAEVLWRMTNAQIFWEAGKYFTILIFGIAMLRKKSWKRPALPILYFGLLCISIPLTLLRLGVSSAARDAISFNLSGPLSLMVCVLYFSQISFDKVSIQRILWFLAIPILGVATLTLSGTLSAGTIEFSNNSNFVTSGGFGPNQVSAILGLGGALLILLFLMGKGIFLRWIPMIIGLVLLALSAITFSRGGLYNAGIMLALALVHSIRSGRRWIATLFALLIIGLVSVYLIFPVLNSFTGGRLEQRFSNLDTTNRAKIAQADLALWSANPVLGVGPGLSEYDRIALLGFEDAAHTEYTRLLAEHGTAGLVALLILLLMSIQAYRRAPNLDVKIWIVALLTWPIVEMAQAAMRIVAISFLFGLAMVNWKPDSRHVEDTETR